MLGLGKPLPLSRLWFVSAALLAASIGRWSLWGVLSGGWDEQGFVVLGALSMTLYQLCDNGGALAYLRWGAA